MPPGLRATTWSARAITARSLFSHDSKAAYQAISSAGTTEIPRNFNRLAARRRGKKYLEYMGDGLPVIARAARRLKGVQLPRVDQGNENRCLSRASNQEARSIAADAFEQKLGYIADRRYGEGLPAGSTGIAHSVDVEQGSVPGIRPMESCTRSPFRAHDVSIILGTPHRRPRRTGNSETS